MPPSRRSTRNASHSRNRCARVDPESRHVTGNRARRELQGRMDKGGEKTSSRLPCLQSAVHAARSQLHGIEIDDEHDMAVLSRVATTMREGDLRVARQLTNHLEILQTPRSTHKRRGMKQAKRRDRRVQRSQICSNWNSIFNLIRAIGVLQRLQLVHAFIRLNDARVDVIHCLPIAEFLEQRVAIAQFRLEFAVE